MTTAGDFFHCEWLAKEAREDPMSEIAIKKRHKFIDGFITQRPSMETWTVCSLDQHKKVFKDKRSANSKHSWTEL